MNGTRKKRSRPWAIVTNPVNRLIAKIKKNAKNAKV